MKSISYINAIATLSILSTGLWSAESPTASSTDGIQPNILDDYIYGYAPVAMAATRDILTAVPDAATRAGFAPINQFARITTLATPDETLVPRPNADTLYTTAWLDLADEPIVLHVPATGGRYYLIPMYDAYTNEFASIGSRTTGNEAGNYAIVGPLWRGTLPRGIAGVINSPTNSVQLIGRTLVRGQTDLASAVATTAQYQLIPLSAFPKFRVTGRYTPPTSVPVTPPNPLFEGIPVTSSQGFSQPAFFDYLLKIALQNPPPPPGVRLTLDGFTRQRDLNADVLAQADTALTNEIHAPDVVENGWSINFRIGAYGTDYLRRATIARFAPGANLPDDAVYPSTSTDLAGNQLSGTQNYVIRFAPDQIPPVKGFWSITVYNDKDQLVVNPINRYSLGSESGLALNADGSLDILLQASAPAALQSNWLPTPNGVFSLSLRLYWPEESVLNGSYVPPPVVANPL